MYSTSKETELMLRSYVDGYIWLAMAFSSFFDSILASNVSIEGCKLQVEVGNIWRARSQCSFR